MWLTLQLQWSYLRRFLILRNDKAGGKKQTKLQNKIKKATFQWLLIYSNLIQHPDKDLKFLLIH
jgi:hypothetical protein